MSDNVNRPNLFEQQAAEMRAAFLYEDLRQEAAACKRAAMSAFDGQNAVSFPLWAAAANEWELLLSSFDPTQTVEADH